MVLMIAFYHTHKKVPKSSNLRKVGNCHSQKQAEGT